MSMKVILALCLLYEQVHAFRDVTFKLVSGKFDARMLYQRSINNVELCLNICYDHELCKFVHYSEDNCTVYKPGTIPYLSSVLTYELDRTLTLPSCPWEVALRPTVKFKPIEVQPDMEVACSGLPSNLTIIHMYFPGRRFVPLYSASDLMENFTEAQRLYFASKPQSQCVSVPVFTGASYSRLYFGDVYNTTGYYFLDAYAFTGKCVCEANACCGNIAIDEYFNSPYSKYGTQGYTYSDKEQNVSLSGAVTSKQQLYIADVKSLI